MSESEVPARTEGACKCQPAFCAAVWADLGSASVTSVTMGQGASGEFV